MTTLRDLTKTSGSVSWSGSDEVKLDAGLKGPFLGVEYRRAGGAVVRNETEDQTVEYKTHVVGPLGDWKDTEQIMLAPGFKSPHNASWDGQHGIVLMNFRTRGFKENDKQNSDGKPTSPLDPATDFLAQYWMHIVGLLVLIFILILLVPALATFVKTGGGAPAG